MFLLPVRLPQIANSENKPVDLVFAQNFPAEYKILTESEKGEEKDIRTYKWKINIPAGEVKELNFSVRIIYR